MNKTIIININGIVFHIEEDAYEVLRTYMTEVKRHFAYSPDSDEIVTDIENRLAEMFTERLNTDFKQVIVLADVNFVTAKMGNVNDFSMEEDEPSPIRNAQHRNGKKLFRDTDDRIISGVCAGIGHYFGVEPRWIRLAALVLLIVTMGSVLPVYIILWIVVPKAITRADKMAMKGEPINIQNFKKNFDEEIEGLKTGFNRAQHEARPAMNQVGKFIGSAGKMLIKFIGAFISFIGIIMLFALTVSLIVFLGYWNSNHLDQFPFNVVNPGYKSVLALSAFILLFIPIAALVMFAIRVTFARFAVSKTVYFTMLVVWLAGLGMGIYHASRIGSDFNDEANFSVTTPLKPSDVYYLKLNDVQYFSKEDSIQYQIDPADFKERIIINNNRDFNMPRNVSLEIVYAGTGKPELIQEFSARGRDFETALDRAKRAKHRFIQTDSLLVFDAATYLERGELWRDQSVHLTLRLPANTKIRIESNVGRYLEDYSLWECKPQNAERDFLSEWTMTPTGLQCKTASTDSNFGDPIDSDTSDMNQNF